MEKRKLGKTGLEVSLIGFGGFHLLEIPAEKARSLLNQYLDMGGNYIETAADYGDGESERKIGPVIEKRRDEVVLASKTGSRIKEGALRDVNRTLNNLRTDHLDILFMHAVKSFEELETIFSEGGAYEAFLELKEKGKVDNLGISMHGQPDVLIKALNKDKFDVVMATFNYFDKFNFPKLEDELLPLAQEKDVGIVLMKALADGFLWKSAEPAFRYAFSLPVSIVVTGINTEEMLKEDIGYAKNYEPMSEKEKEDLYLNAPELGDYVCRQCEECIDCPEDIDIKEIFKLEGYYDRQMRDGKVRNPADFALRDRLRFWFEGEEKAKSLYEELEVKADECTECEECINQCPYNLPIMKKLNIAHYKLSGEDVLF